MTEQFFDFPSPFIKTTKKTPLTISILKCGEFTAWNDKNSALVKTQLKTSGFDGKNGQFVLLQNSKGELNKAVFASGKDLSLFDGSSIYQKLSQTIDRKLLGSIVFCFDEKKLKAPDLEKLCMGWALESYSFDLYKAATPPDPVKLLAPKSIDLKSLTAQYEAVFLLRNIVNTPANDFGPDDMEEVCQTIAQTLKAKISVITGEELLEQNYPLIHTVGDASPRRPRLIELRWGKKSDPALTLVGKGVCYDTGGLSLKPSRSMLLMRKDMAGGAHVLALAAIIIKHQLPVNLRVLIPTVDNDISGGAMRPGDIATSRKGLTVEITNTDAEGRLILSDALTAASEEKPDLIIDFATLTGAKMSALGHDIAAYFSNNDSITLALQKYSGSEEDPIWPFPIWHDYNRFVESKVADITNSALAPGDLLYSALYLHKFIDPKIDWVHLDIYAWENIGRPGRSLGAKECGLRAVWAYLQERYQ